VKLKNNTHWSTRDLRRIAARVVREEFPRERFGDRAKRYTVVVGYNRSGKFGDGSCSGYAYYNSNSCNVNVPSGYVSPFDFAYVVGHECGHSKGFKHGRMAPHHEHRTDYAREHYAWTGKFCIDKKAKKVKAKPSAAAVVDAKLQHALAMLKRAESRVKRAASLQKRWTQKVRYYQKRAEQRVQEQAQAAAACTKGGQS